MCVGAYLYMAIKLFEQDKTELVYDYNKNLVTTISSDFQSLLSRVSDRLDLITHLKSDSETKEFLARNEDIIYLGKSLDFQSLDSHIYFDRDFMESYGLEEKQLLAHLDRMLSQQSLRTPSGVWALGDSGQIPALGFHKTIFNLKNPKHPHQYSMVALVRIESLHKVIDDNSYSQVSVYTQDGERLIGATEKSLYELIKSNESSMAISTTVLKLKYLSEDILGAYKRMDNGLFVISSVGSKKAFSAVNILVYRSVLFSSIVLTLAFIIAVIFSKSLTKPIEILVQGMSRVSQGFLDTKIEVTTRDEIHLLGDSFNKMISDLKASRQALESANKNLEKKVRERTEQLDKQNQAVKMAQEALLNTTRLAAVGETAGRAAHEVLNPLTNIMNRTQIINNKNTLDIIVDHLQSLAKGWGEDYEKGGFEGLISGLKQKSKIYEDKNLLEEDIQNLNNVSKTLSDFQSQLKNDILFLMSESSRINKIVQSMRSMSKPKGEARPYDPNYLIKESIYIMADYASKYGVEIQYKPKEAMGTVKVDYDEFIQSLTNLIRNSIQAIEEKSKLHGEFNGIIKINLFVCDKHIEIQVEDNGIGIDASFKDKVFRTQFTTKANKDGTGLGLNISRRFIRSFDGDIQLHSTEKGQGTTMIITLPKSNAEAKSA